MARGCQLAINEYPWKLYTKLKVRTQICLWHFTGNALLGRIAKFRSDTWTLGGDIDSKNFGTLSNVAARIISRIEFCDIQVVASTIGHKLWGGSRNLIVAEGADNNPRKLARYRSTELI